MQVYQPSWIKNTSSVYGSPSKVNVTSAYVSPYKQPIVNKPPVVNVSSYVAPKPSAVNPPRPNNNTTTVVNPPRPNNNTTNPPRPNNNTTNPSRPNNTTTTTTTTTAAAAKPQTVTAAAVAAKPAQVITTTTTTAATTSNTKTNNTAALNAAKSDVRPTCAVTKAVFVGINYVGTAAALNGCITDTKLALKTMREFGFKGIENKDYLILTEEKGRQRPTKDNIIKAMQWLTKDAKANDVLWFHFSGHGSQQKCGPYDKEEMDGLDETLVPLDYDTAGMITDNDMYTSLVKNIPKDSTLYCIFDCCHSGTILDLKHVYDERKRTWVTDPSIRDRRENEGLVYLVSGCQSAQTSADLPPSSKLAILKESIGAMSASLYPCLGKPFTWINFISRVRETLKGAKMTQVPQLECCKAEDLHEQAFYYAFPLPDDAPVDDTQVSELEKADRPSRISVLKQKKYDAEQANAAAAALSTTSSASASAAPAQRRMGEDRALGVSSEASHDHYEGDHNHHEHEGHDHDQHEQLYSHASAAHEGSEEEESAQQGGSGDAHWKFSNTMQWGKYHNQGGAGSPARKSHAQVMNQNRTKLW